VVGAVSAVHLTARIRSRSNFTHSIMRDPRGLSLIAGSTDSAFRAVCSFAPPSRSHHVISFMPQVRRVLVALLLRIIGHASDLVGERYGGDLVDRRANNFASYGRCLALWGFA
jgi:hypothetical protein